MRKLLAIAGAMALMHSMSYAGALFGWSVQSNGDDHLYRINLSTGLATDLGAVGLNDAEGVSFGPGGNLYAIGGTVEEFWDITTPPGFMVGATGSRDGIDAGLGYNVWNGTMYNIQGAGSGASVLYSVNVGNGSTALIGRGDAFADNIAFWNGVAYAQDWIFSDSLYTVNLADGSMTVVGALNVGNVSAQAGSSFSDTGTLYTLTSGGEIYTVNTGNGQATYVTDVIDAAGRTMTGWEGLALQPVPEPATIAGLAFGSLALLARRRRKS